MKYNRYLIFLLLFTIPLISFSYFYPFEKYIYSGKKINNKNQIQEKISSMTLREKIAQMIISSSDGYSLDKNSKEYNRLKNLVINQKIGGFIFFKGNSLQEAEIINDLQSISETPLLISADFERGTKMRLDDGSLFPNNMAIGATRNPKLAYQMGLLIAKECRAIGIHQNYAPVLDVNNNSKNPIINVRSFGEDPLLVSQMGTAMIKGIQDGNVIATGKHFPGHGDTDIDSHNDLPVLNFDMTRLNNIELVPFKNAINSGVKSVMIAHLSFPAIENTPYIPASLSEKIVNGILINQIGFHGLIVTDALNMSGITKHFSTKEVALMCVNAGIDLILMPQGEELSIKAIEQAVINGDIKEERINYSVQKILEAKEWLGLNENKMVDLEKINSIVNSEEEQILSQMIADESVTLVKNDNNILPFKKANSNILLLSLNNGNDKGNSDLFLKKLDVKSRGYFNKINIFEQNGEVSNAEEIISASTEADYILIPIYAKVKIKTGTVGLPESQISLIKALKEKGKKVIVISFGNPYLLQGFEDIDSYICAYGDGESSINASIKGILGEIKFKGKLPVTINESYKFGDGINN
jgi:beta-glucosidase-like glycosyl hydrolase